MPSPLTVGVEDGLVGVRAMSRQGCDPLWQRDLARVFADRSQSAHMMTRRRTESDNVSMKKTKRLLVQVAFS